MILESLDVEYKEKGSKHVYLVVIGKEESEQFVEVIGVSAVSEEDCLRQCGGKRKVFKITPLFHMLESLEMESALEDMAPFTGYGGKNEAGLH
jgi:hypothetical protein